MIRLLSCLFILGLIGLHGTPEGIAVPGPCPPLFEESAIGSKSSEVSNSIDFKTPKNLKRRVVSPEELHWVKGKAAEIGSNFDDYLKKIIKIRTAVSQKFSRAKDVKWVLYPASGSDAGYPTLLFKNANVIAIDNHPIVSKRVAASTGKINLKVPSEENMNATHQWTGDFGETSSLLGQILSRLTRSIKNFRLKGIELFTQNTDGAVHGIIQFDTGPRTPARKYIQIQSRGGESFEPNSWWHKSLLDLQLDAVVVKASQTAVGTGDFRNEILAALLRSQGLLVEGLNMCGPLDRNNSGELSGYGPKFRHMFRRPNLTIPIERFGYGDKVYVFQFKKPFSKDELQEWD